jgi:hypothetical protein
VDSHGWGRLEARLPRVVAALGAYAGRASAFASPRIEGSRAFHDLAGYDLALVHESDARKDDGAFLERCWTAATPCVLYSGGIDRGRTLSPRLLEVPDDLLIAHAEDGAAFLEQTGRLQLGAWTRGVVDARRAEVNELCRRLRSPFLSNPQHAVTAADLSTLSALRGWSTDATFLRRVSELEAIFEHLAAALEPADAALSQQIVQLLSHIVAAA